MIVNQNTALIDKMVLNNLLVTDISDIDYLAKMGILEVNPNPDVRSYYTDGGSFRQLKIKQDDKIDLLSAGTVKTGKIWHTYCNLHTSVHRLNGNLACYTVQDYQQQVNDIQTALRGKYGVVLDTMWATIKQIEINRTIRLNDDFKWYHRVLQLIMFNLPYPFAKQMDFKKKAAGEIQCDTYYATTKKTAKSKKYQELKIYNKSKQLQFIVSDGWMRVELKIVGASKVKKELGTNDLSELTDGQINDYFDRMMQKLIVQPYRKWQEQQKKEIKKIMQEQRKINLKRWQIGTLTRILDEEIDRQCPVALDIDQILAVVPELKDVQTKYVKTIQQNMDDQAGKCAAVLCNYDSERMEEIIEKLTSKSDTL
nr:unnamed protein product [uncultured bacterium]